MAFSSLLFLTVFLPIYVVLYWASPKRMRNATMLGLSLLFYAWGAPWFMPVILGLGIVDFALARVIEKRRGEPIAKRIVIGAVTMHLSVLAYFKYSNFFVGETSSLLAHFGATPFKWAAVALPIGVSFLTFEEISYIVDVYRGHAKPAKSLSRYLLFLMLFPHSIAGPIFRWKDLEKQLYERNEKIDDVVEGLSRFVWGLAKKILIADAAAITADAAFSLEPSQATFGIAWLGATAYAIQIFYDFSGYSDMAIGLGRIAGFKFKENFNDPYISASITEFWTRWHMSLSSWLRDLYIPLGGNRKGETRTRINVMIVFVLSGFWHGAAWTFMLWGAYHGALTVIERTELGRRWREQTPRVVAVPVTFALAVIGWVFFRAKTADQAFGFIKAMFGFGAHPAFEPLLRGHLLPNRSIAFLSLGLVIVAIKAILANRPSSPSRTRWLFVALAPIILVLAILQVVNTKFVPLIYFKF